MSNDEYGENVILEYEDEEEYAHQFENDTRYENNTGDEEHNEDCVDKCNNEEFVDISALFGRMGKKFIKASLSLQVSNEIENLAFIRHMISYYAFHCTAGRYIKDSISSLEELKQKLPKVRDICKYFKEYDISSLSKFELLAIKVILDIHFYTEKLFGSPPFKRLSSMIIPLMIKFYENIPQAKFSIMITMYRAFAEDSRELLSEMDNLVFAVSHIAYSTPYPFLLRLNKELESLKEITEGCNEDHFYV